MENFDVLRFLQALLLLSAAVFVLGLLLRLIMGKGSDLNKSVGAAFGILMVYVVTVLISIQNHYEIFLSPLPFVSYAGDCLSVFKLGGAPVDAVCAELVKMITLSFCVGIVQGLLPKGKGFFVWLLLRIAVVAASMAVHNTVTHYLSIYVPTLYAVSNVVLLILAIAFLATTVFRWIVAGILGLTVNPIVGAIYGFSAKTLVGKQILQSVLTTVIMLLLVYVINITGNYEIIINSALLASYIPSLVVIIVVWYLWSKFC